MRELLLLNVGGTIATESSNPLNFVEYPFNSRRLSARELIEQLQTATGGTSRYHITGRDLSRGSSLAVGPKEWQKLRSTLGTALSAQQKLDGVVVSHGTSTLEETAYFLALTFAHHRTPVVLTGSQRPLGVLGSDALLSLHYASLVAADPLSAGRGVIVYSAGKLFSAWGLSKQVNYELAPFGSTYHPPIGSVTFESKVFFFGNPLATDVTPPFEALSPLLELPRVDIVSSYAGADGMLLEAARRAGARGIVLEGAPPGLATLAQMEELKQFIAEGIPVLLCSRARKDPTTPVRALEKEGLIFLSNLSARQARILLMTAIGCGWPNERIALFISQNNL